MAEQKRIVIYTDFDETMIKEDSAKIMAKKMIRFYKKTFGFLFLPGFLTQVLYRYVTYKITGKTSEFYTIFFHFDAQALQLVADHLTLNRKWVAAVQRIRKKEQNPRVLLVILSRNVIGLIRRYLERSDVQRYLAALNCSVSKVIAHADILVDSRTIVSSGIWRPGQKMNFISREGKVLRTLSKEEFRRTVAVRVIPEQEYGAQIIDCINKDKQVFLPKKKPNEKFPFYYLGDKEEQYLSPADIPREHFYRI
ncbi:hypothetical protein HY495_03235 [Candidatus Woesearchaeota archaeon]|nr:hypothetical protein [Candidatus Woesearchaeota archaeon]